MNAHAAMPVERRRLELDTAVFAIERAALGPVDHGRMHLQPPRIAKRPVGQLQRDRLLKLDLIVIDLARFIERDDELDRLARWIAYGSTETGREEVFVRPFPDVDAGKVQLSTAGGTVPYWAHNGSELFFVEPSTRTMTAARFETTPRFRVVVREPLFTIPTQYDISPVALLYDVTQDNQRFVMSRRYEAAREGDEGRTNAFVLVQNFFEELRERVPN